MLRPDVLHTEQNRSAVLVHASGVASVALALHAAALAQGPYTLAMQTGNNCYVSASYRLCCGLPGSQGAGQSIPPGAPITGAGVTAVASIPQGSRGALSISAALGTLRLGQDCIAGFPSGPAITEGAAGSPYFENEVLMTITGTGALVSGVLDISYSGAGPGAGACTVELPNTGLPGFHADQTTFGNALLGVSGPSPLQVLIKGHANVQGVFGSAHYSQVIVIDFHPAEAPLVTGYASPCGADLTLTCTFRPLTRTHAIQRQVDHAAANALVFDILGATPVSFPIPGSPCSLFTDILVLPGNVPTDGNGHADLVSFDLPWDMRGTFQSQAVLVDPMFAVSASNPLRITAR